MMNIFIMDLCQYSQEQIDREQFKSIDEVRHAGPVIGLSENMTKKQQSLKQFLRNKLYLHPRVKSMTDNAHEVIEKLFKKFMQNPNYANINGNFDKNELASHVSDYIAGMTDRFALQTFEKKCK